MRLPEHIYKPVKKHFPGHGYWHTARQPNRAAMRGSGNPFPGLIGLNEPGSGEQFLLFHREMIRIFKWIIETTDGPKYNFVAWDTFPPWLSGYFESARPGYLAEAFQEMNRLVNEGTANDLGNFIEATALNSHPAGNIHNFAHGTIAWHEQTTFGARHGRLTDAAMNNFATSHHNEHFWGLHGWIDNIFANWQRQHGEVVDQSPLPPSKSVHHHSHTTENSHHHMHIAFETPITMSPKERAKIFRPIWDF